MAKFLGAGCGSFAAPLGVWCVAPLRTGYRVPECGVTFSIFSRSLCRIVKNSDKYLHTGAELDRLSDETG